MENERKVPIRKPKVNLPKVELKAVPVPGVIKIQWHVKVWRFLKGKKRRIAGVCTLIGNTALLWGETVIGGTFLAIASLFYGGDLAEYSGEKLNEKTSGEKINWNEVLEMIWNTLKKLWKLITHK